MPEYETERVSLSCGSQVICEQIIYCYDIQIGINIRHSTPEKDMGVIEHEMCSSSICLVSEKVNFVGLCCLSSARDLGCVQKLPFCHLKGFIATT